MSMGYMPLDNTAKSLEEVLKEYHHCTVMNPSTEYILGRNDVLYSLETEIEKLLIDTDPDSKEHEAYKKCLAMINKERHECILNIQKL